MPIQSLPNIFMVYYCNNCESIIASSDINRIILTSPGQCPLCLEDTLTVLPQEDYPDNFNPQDFPNPQDAILTSFFEHSNNLTEIINAFGTIPNFYDLNLEIVELGDPNLLHILITPLIEFQLKVQDTDGTEHEIEQRIVQDTTQSNGGV
ncbi:hypothetical protein [Crocosphaera sp.]|uniref:hypothetical protein n=1 Tax=Crocosphaera sp. TaxID=2729996 RepID=UPI002608BF79|nr:hypothetical protein [Crocosphaera sp.]MDJ0582961.1 hypothetical protein [Crocosphaera sp.]